MRLLARVSRLRAASVTEPLEKREKGGCAGVLMVRVCLWGSARIYGDDGHRIEITSRKGLALLALLITAPDGERTRSYLQDRLWGSREREQAQQSLRRELNGLRKAFADYPDLIRATRDRIRIDLSEVMLDDTGRYAGAEFLEGFDLQGEDEFEDWLREQRQSYSNDRNASSRKLRPAAAAHQPMTADDRSGRPGVVILALDSNGGGSGESGRPDSFTDDLAELLARFRWLRVIMPEAATADDRPRFSMADLAWKAQATYALQLRRLSRDGELVLTASLHDAIAGQLLWSDAYPEPMLSSQTQADVIARLAMAVDARIDNEEQARVLDLPLDALDADQALIRARWHLARLSRDDAGIARELLADALRQRPNSANVLIQCAFAKAWDIWSGRGGEADMLEMRALALRAMAADGFDARGYMLAGMAEMWLRNHRQAEIHFLEALRLNPSLAYAHAQIGSNYYLSGRPAEAIGPLRRFMELSPLDNQAFYVLSELSVAFFMLGDYAAALDHAEQSMARRPAYIFAHAMKVNALLCLERDEDAREALDRLLQAKPRFVPDDLDWQPFADRSWTQRLKDGIERARAA